MRFFSSALLRRLEAAVLAALTLWVVYVTAGSETVTSAAAALWEAVPIELLKWELGDARAEGTLSPTAAMVIREWRKCSLNLRRRNVCRKQRRNR